jgi:hypothetical protein
MRRILLLKLKKCGRRTFFKPENVLRATPVFVEQLRTNDASIKEIQEIQTMRLQNVLSLLFALSCFAVAIDASAQVVPPAMIASFNPSSVGLGPTNPTILTITLTNSNAVPLTNVTFSNTAPAGLTLVTQTGGTCSTLATGGGMFSINPGSGVFSSTSSVLAGGQSCDITVRMYATVAGQIVDMTSTVTSNEAAPGEAAMAILNASTPVRLQSFEVE